MVFINLLSFFGLILTSTANSLGPLVNTPLGSVRGIYSTSYSKQTYSSFLSIPYAQPPIGELRFREPLPIKPWSGEVQANSSTKCSQMFHNEYVGDENCLTLNIHIPSTDPAKIEKKLPVIVHIHGGAWMFGSGDDYAGPKFIIDKNVIFVTMNYRLGAFGFLSIQCKMVPGNNGLKDQSLALKWIKKYINSFGGDPEQITITGMSAGGASVHYHYLSPQSKELFKNGISFSGSALNPWTVQEAPIRKAKKLGNALGCNSNKISDMVKCLRTKTAKEIAESTNKIMYYWLDNPFSPFGPVVEPENTNPNDAFLTEHPYKIIKEGKVQDLPWVVTVTEDEGLYPAAGWIDDEKNLLELEKRWHDICPFVFDFNYTIPQKDHFLVCDQIKKYYLNDVPITMNNFKSLVKAISDRMFIKTIEQAAKMTALKVSSPVYVYKFNYVSEQLPSLTKLFSKYPRQGVSHGDDITMIFDLDNHNITSIPSANDQIIQNNLFDFILSFAATGHPVSGNIRWEPLQKTGPLDYLYIESPNVFQMKQNDSIGNAEFWNKIPFEENENLFK